MKDSYYVGGRSLHCFEKRRVCSFRKGDTKRAVPPHYYAPNSVTNSGSSLRDFAAVASSK